MLLANSTVLADYLGVSKPLQEVSFKGVSTDTRKPCRGRLFVALKGEHFDGHDYLEQAFSMGAALAIVEKKTPFPSIIVPETRQAYGRLARLNRNRQMAKVIAITGSSGKTTTTKLLASILSQAAPTHATRENHNNELGVPETLLGIDHRHRFCVVEMGARKKGDIAYLMSLANPDVALITNAGLAHVEIFGSLKALVAGKGEAYQHLESDKIAVIDKSSPHLLTWQRLSVGKQHFYYGGDSALQVKGVKLSPRCSTFVLCYKGQEHPISLALPGAHQLQNTLAASACALALGVGLATIAKGLSQVETISGRFKSQNIAGIEVIDDTYNANPDSSRAAIETFCLGTGERVVVLGKMVELGVKSLEYHRLIGDLATEKADAFYTLGTGAEAYKGRHFVDSDTLAKQLLSSHPGAKVLVKGSRSAGMESLISSLYKASK